jgi:hypothetical protein
MTFNVEMHKLKKGGYDQLLITRLDDDDKDRFLNDEGQYGVDIAKMVYSYFYNYRGSQAYDFLHNTEGYVFVPQVFTRAGWQHGQHMFPNEMHDPDRVFQMAIVYEANAYNDIAAISIIRMPESVAMKV